MARMARRKALPTDKKYGLRLYGFVSKGGVMEPFGPDHVLVRTASPNQLNDDAKVLVEVAEAQCNRHYFEEGVRADMLYMIDKAIDGMRWPASRECLKKAVRKCTAPTRVTSRKPVGM